MIRQYTRLLTLIFLGSALLPIITLISSQIINDRAELFRSIPAYAICAVGALLATVAVRYFLGRLEPTWQWTAEAQTDFLQNFSDNYVNGAIFAAAAVSLFAELSIIRWQATVFPFFALYKNFSMLACFAGLGLGYALARQLVPLLVTIPLFCWQFILLIGMRYGLSDRQLESLFLSPFREQLNMGLNNAFLYGLQTYFVIGVVFLLTALAFLPIGQLCGLLMERREKLPAYGLNLAGSLAGVLLTFLVSALWLPPSAWFLLTLVPLLLFYVRQRTTLVLGAALVSLSLLVLDWPVNPMWQRIYSPYQLLEVGHENNGLMTIRAAGHYYQKILNLGLPPDATDPVTEKARNYYELPYQLHRPPENVAVVGAGTGNDVAAALRAGVRHVDAIEIDPAILKLGEAAHPEHPYQDSRVRAIVSDARSFLRGTNQTYDLIVFGLLDSHTLLSQASNVRLDSFVYTVQSFREARARLRPHGRISLAFSVLNPRLGRKIYLMLQQAFAGRAPLCIEVGYNMGVVFLASDDDLTLPAELLARSGFTDVTTTYADSTLPTDVSTDDWPFFYMPSRVYPVSYLGMVVVVLLLSLVLSKSFVREKVRLGNLPFLLMGAGFMLVETKSITELGLAFGNSWQVIGVVLGSIMLMAYLANWVVQRIDINRPEIPLLLLLATLALGWWLSGSGGMPPTFSGRVLSAVVLTCPLFFSGIVFSTLLRFPGKITGAMSANIFGAMCGGLLEYNSMYFGFRFLDIVAGGLYVLVLAWIIFRLRLGSLIAVDKGSTFKAA
jgi:SAM-dependent methyltransferase